MNKIKPDIPLWAKPGKRVWVEIRDKAQLEVLEYTEGVIARVDFDTKDLVVKDADSAEERDQRGDRIHEREESHAIVSDLADIPTLNDAELLKHLEVRYRNNMIHCYCGPTLIVINPYKKIEHEESEETRNKILKCLMEKRVRDAVPHVWTISATSWDYMLSQQQNQAICISGESGAGKTECTKRCLEFITQMKGESRSLTYVPIEQKIMSCNPLLEALGNAKTFRNDNSSRFGKYTTLFIDKNKKSVKGASIDNYLLEKSRVTNLGDQERNYHIFYAMCRFMPKDQRIKYKLAESNGETKMNSFNYLNQSSIYDSPKINDKEFYDDVNRSFTDLDFTASQQDAIWRTLATILHLGNVQVDESTYVEGSKPCRIVRNDAWSKIISLLQIDESAFEEGLTNREIRVGASVTKSPLSPGRAKNSIDTIARDFYNRMFNWVIKKLNKTLLPPDPKDPNFLTIGVLDIFGFEIFGKNSIEQLFINFANEKLQGLYIDYIFKNECRIFDEEGLGQYTFLIQYKDNKPLLLSLDNPKLPPGVFDLVDQTCSLNKNDETLHSEIMKAHKNSDYIGFPKLAKQLSFIVKHTARDVEYVTDGFVEKNKDELSPFLQSAIETSHKEIVDIFNEVSGLDIVKSSGEEVKKNPKEKYLGFKFRRNMDDLINTLARCYCHFVRCIKPNEKKEANLWVGSLALMQVRYMGLLDSLKVRKLSYPFRFEYRRFFEIYQDLDSGANGARNFNELVSKEANFLELSKELLRYCGVAFSEKDLLYGKTRIFLNERFKIDMDKALMVKQKAKKESLKVITNLYRNYLTKRSALNFFGSTSRSISLSRDLLRSWTAKLDGMKFKNKLKAVRKIQRFFRSQQQKRGQRSQMSNMELVAKFLGLYKFSKTITYILDHRRKVLLMQAMLDKKIRDEKQRFCKSFFDVVFDDAWIQIRKRMLDNSVRDMQRTFRAYLERKQRQPEYEVLLQKVEEGKEYNAAANIQRFVRGFLVRSRLKKLNRAASKIQGFVRTVWIRSYFKIILHATRVIQRFFRKMLVRREQTNVRMEEFLIENGGAIDSVIKLERDLLFIDSEIPGDQNHETPFNSSVGQLHQNALNFRQFIPASRDIELDAKAKLISVVVDLTPHIDSSGVYQSSWAIEFSSFLRKAHSRGARLLHLEIGESFTLAITDDKEIYSWGVNDYGQCGRERFSEGYSIDCAPVKNLTNTNPQFLSAGKDHGLIVADGSKIFTWGKNVDGQLGLGHARDVDYIGAVSTGKDKIKSAVAKEGFNVLLTTEGRVFSWPRNCFGEPESDVIDSSTNVFSPCEIPFAQNVKIASVEAGTDFAVFLATNGLLYSIGENSYGELGVGDKKRRSSPVLISALKDLNEKIVEVSCGHKHVIVQSTVGRMYAWGMNSSFQLAQADKKPRLSPVKFVVPEYQNLRCKPRNVQAGLSSCVVLFEDRHIYYSGILGIASAKPAKHPTRLFYEDKVN